MLLWTLAPASSAEYEVVQLADLGWLTHSPGRTKQKCWLDERTKAGGLPTDPHALGAEFWNLVSAKPLGELTLCWWHRWPWPYLMELAIWSWQNASTVTQEQLRASLASERLDPDLAGLVELMILDPITFVRDGRVVRNGFHRLCAFHMTQVQRVLVRVS